MTDAKVILTSEMARRIIGAPHTGEVDMTLMPDGEIVVAHPDVPVHFLRLCTVTGAWLVSSADRDVTVSVYTAKGLPIGRRAIRRMASRSRVSGSTTPRTRRRRPESPSR